jgi:hypothetical protein
MFHPPTRVPSGNSHRIVHFFDHKPHSAHDRIEDILADARASFRGAVAAIDELPHGRPRRLAPCPHPPGQQRKAPPTSSSSLSARCTSSQHRARKRRRSNTARPAGCSGKGWRKRNAPPAFSPPNERPSNCTTAPEHFAQQGPHRRSRTQAAPAHAASRPPGRASRPTERESAPPDPRSAGSSRSARARRPNALSAPPPARSPVPRKST